MGCTELNHVYFRVRCVGPLPRLDTQQSRGEETGVGVGVASFFLHQDSIQVGVTQPDSLSLARKDSETASVALSGFCCLFLKWCLTEKPRLAWNQVLLPWTSKCWDYTMCHYAWLPLVYGWGSLGGPSPPS